MDVVSLFSGIGGLDEGLCRAGFSTRLALEIDPAAQGVLRQVLPDAIVPDCGDVRVAGRRSPKALGIGSVSNLVLTAGVPCQPFSRAASWVTGGVRGTRDERGRLIDEVAHFVSKLKPAVVVVENVPAFGGATSDSALLRLELALQKIRFRGGGAYEVSSSVLDASDFGVPQRRRRLFVVASRLGRFDFSAMRERHCDPRCAWDALASVRTDASREELAPTGRWAALLPSIPPGMNYLWHTPGGGGVPIFGHRTRFWSFLLKLSPSLPSWTVTASPGPSTGPFHWDNRKLSLAELAALQTLTRKVDWNDVTYRAGVRLIGNAVPSQLAQVLGDEIAHQLFGRARRVVPQLPVARTAAVLPPMIGAPTTLVPQSSPAPHPGVGRGPGAVRDKLPKSGDLRKPTLRGFG